LTNYGEKLSYLKYTLEMVVKNTKDKLKISNARNCGKTKTGLVTKKRMLANWLFYLKMSLNFVFAL